MKRHLNRIIVRTGLVVLLASGFGYAFAQSQNDDPECEPGATTCGGYDCSTGSVANPGTLNPTSKEICVGGSVTTPTVSGTTFNLGYKERLCTDGCEEWPDGADISYSPEYRWDPAIPATINNCGTYSYNCYVKGVTTDTDCPSSTGEVLVGTYTVTVKEIKGSASCDLMDPEIGTTAVCPQCVNCNWETIQATAAVEAEVSYCGGATATLRMKVTPKKCPWANSSFNETLTVPLSGTRDWPSAYVNQPSGTSAPRELPDGNCAKYTGWGRWIIVTWQITPGVCDATVTVAQGKVWEP